MDRLLTASDVCKLLKCSPRWLRYASERVPGRVTLGPRAVRWRLSVLQEWIAAGCPDPKRQDAATSGNCEDWSGTADDDAQNAGGVAGFQDG